MHFCVFAILFSIAVLSATFITVISSFIIYFYYLFLFSSLIWTIGLIQIND